MTTVIWWIRRDLRLIDNPANQTAREHAETVLPVFILDPWLLNKPAEKRIAFLYQGLRSLDASLAARGNGLIVRAGEPLAELARLVEESGASGIVAEADHSPYARRRDTAVAQALPLTLVNGVTIHPPGAILKPNGTPYVVFTPYSRAWLSASGTPPEPGPMVGLVRDVAHGPRSLSIPTGPVVADFPAGEAEGWRRLEAFCRGPIWNYHLERDRLDLPGTALLSPYLRWGMVSIRQVYRSALLAAAAAPDDAAREGVSAWINELIWREFYFSILYHFPGVARTAFQPQFRDLEWVDRPDLIEAWESGQTGYPIVDAAMRQLAATGWMHNRARMVVASFLVKDLLVNWQIGEKWFMRNLVDGDLAANNGGWQWTAGVGTDAAPYFRVFSPIRQAEKFDPDGNFVRRWVPELGPVPNRYLHEPWRMPVAEQHACGVRIGGQYPSPIIDHGEASARVKNLYRQNR